MASATTPMAMTSNLPGIVALGALFFAIAYRCYDLNKKAVARRRYMRDIGCKEPRWAPAKDPLFALDRFWTLAKAAKERKYLQTWQHWFETIGTTFAMRLMGDDVIFTNEPKNVQALLITQFKSFELGHRRRTAAHRFLGSGIFNSDGPAWERGRALVRPNFTRRQVSVIQNYEKHAQALMRAIDRGSGNGEPLDIQPLLFRFTMDLSTEYLFGESTGVLNDDAAAKAQDFAWAFDVCLDNISQRIRLGKFGSLYYDSRYGKACKILHAYVTPIINRAIATACDMSSDGKETEEARYSFLVTMAKEGATVEQLTDQVMNILVAARDTTACLLAAAMFEMGQHPNSVTGLREDVSRLHGQLPSYEDLKQMGSLTNFLRETLRLHPPVPLNGRVSCEDTFLPLGGGEDGESPIFIPKDQLVIYQVYSMHRRTDLWGPDAETFRPSRWKEARPTFEYLPFNAGPRICIGQQFALTEAAYLLTRLLQTYPQIEALQKGIQWEENVTLTCSISNGVWLRFGRLCP